MDGELRKALEHAKGQSEHIFAVVADIREFSAFSQQHDSRDVATYIKRVYIRLIDCYFPHAKFYKATGDGLLIAIPYEDEDLRETAQETVDSCLHCVSEFVDLCKGDPMVNFQTPDKIGFGIARGAACCLVSVETELDSGIASPKKRETVLDYSGHLLNLASRLMDLARPSGIVLDGAFDLELLDKKTRRLFAEEDVYMRSVAEEQPRRVYVLKDVVELSEQAKRPLSLETWETITTSRTPHQWLVLNVPYVEVELTKRLKRGDGIVVELRYQPRPRRKTVGSGFIFRRLNPDEYTCTVVANRACVSVEIDKILEYASQEKLVSDQKLELWISYVPE
jgi:class 3 adenylate cyclase